MLHRKIEKLRITTEEPNPRGAVAIGLRRGTKVLRGQKTADGLNLWVEHTPEETETEIRKFIVVREGAWVPDNAVFISAADDKVDGVLAPNRGATFPTFLYEGGD